MGQTNRAKEAKASKRPRCASFPLSLANLDLFIFLLFCLHPHPQNTTKPKPKPATQIGNVKVGSEHPVRLQTMTTTGESWREGERESRRER